MGHRKEPYLKDGGLTVFFIWQSKGDYILNKGTITISKLLILIKLENNDLYCSANCPIIH